MHRAVLLSVALFAAVPFASQADEQQDYDDYINLAARICPDHSRDGTRIGIRNVEINALRIMKRTGYYLCPFKKVESPAAVIFYPDYNMFTWNPDVPASVSALRIVTSNLAGTEEYPNVLTVWDANGKKLTNQQVYTFKPRETRW